MIKEPGVLVDHVVIVHSKLEELVREGHLKDGEWEISHQAYTIESYKTDELWARLSVEERQFKEDWLAKRRELKAVEQNLTEQFNKDATDQTNAGGAPGNGEGPSPGAVSSGGDAAGKEGSHG